MKYDVVFYVRGEETPFVIYEVTASDPAQAEAIAMERLEIECDVVETE